MSEEEIPMAQCGACNSIIPLNSESCPDCGARFSGISEETLGECGQCGSIISADSVSCPDCSAVFVDLSSKPERKPPRRKDTELVDNNVKPAKDITSPEVSSFKTEEVDTIDDYVEPDTVTDKEQENEPEEQIADTENVTEDTDFNDDELLISEEEDIEQIVNDVGESAGTSDDEDSAEIEPTIEYEDTDSDTETADFNEAEIEISSDDVVVEDVMEDLVEEIQHSEEEIIEDSSEEQEEDIDSEEEIIEDISEESEGEIDSENDTAESDDELESEIEEDDTVEESKTEKKIEDTEVVMAFENLALAIAAKGMTASEAFGEMDSSDDNLIDAPELQKGIEKIAGEKLTPKHVTAILKYLDKDNNKRVDVIELVNALDDLRIGIQPGKIPQTKTFPSPVQKFLMGKKANDVFYPIAYFLMVTFIGLWVVNGMGLLVDGSGGPVVYEGGTDQWGGEITEANWDLCQSDAFDEMIEPCEGTVEVGQTYPCDPALDPNKCQNSLTPFSGTNGASSMPAKFYTDGIVMIALGVVGIAVVAYLHLVYAPSLRKRAKSGTEEELTDTNDEESEDIIEESVLDAPKDLEVSDSQPEEDADIDDEEYDEPDEDDSDDEEYEDDGVIDVGDWIGLEVDGEEFFGEIIEFDDEEGTVTIETDDGEEITGDQEDMFLEDDE